MKKSSLYRVNVKIFHNNSLLLFVNFPRNLNKSLEMLACWPQGHKTNDKKELGANILFIMQWEWIVVVG